MKQYLYCETKWICVQHICVQNCNVFLIECPLSYEVAFLSLLTNVSFTSVFFRYHKKTCFFWVIFSSFYPKLMIIFGGEVFFGCSKKMDSVLLFSQLEHGFLIVFSSLIYNDF